MGLVLAAAAQDKDLCPVKFPLFPLGRLPGKGRTWLSSPQILGSCDIELRLGKKSSTDTEMLQG